MRRFLAVAAAVFVCCAAAPKDDPPPAWAYVIYQPGPSPKDTLITVPGSKLHLMAKKLEDPFFAVDWFAEDHPQMPPVVARGHAPKLWSCSFCHSPAGVGGSDSAVIAGLPAGYIEEQFAEFRSGRRRCAVAKDPSCSEAMQTIAAAANPSEVKEAAAYFASVQYRSRLHVVEAALVPKTRPGGYFLVRSGGTEPIGSRIIELPGDVVREQHADWRNPVTAYVPPGSIARGRTLVERTACASCHGAHLQGLGLVPPLAGRSPTYIVRQLYDIQYGFRAGPAPMKPVVAHLTAPDRIAIAAYLASLPN
jgi:cytochrome c553